MSIVYFSLMIHDQKEIIVSKLFESVKSLLKEVYVTENIVVGQTIVKEDTQVDIIVKLNFNINVKIKPESSRICVVGHL